MEAIEIVEGLVGFAKRGAGTDAERRAAGWLASQLSRDGEDATIETFWCRPNWAMTHALHAALAVAASLASLLSPVAAIAILGVTLTSIVADSLTGRSPTRRLTRERASQNVTWTPTSTNTRDDDQRVHLIVTASYDAPRSGIVYRSWLRRPTGSVRAALNGNAPGWLGWLAIATVWLLAIAILRLEGHTSQTIGALQLPPTAGLLVALALLLDIATSDWSPRAGESATGPAVAVTLAHRLQRDPPRNLDVELLLTGASAADQIGLRRYLRARRGERTARNTVVLGIAPCVAGPPHWWFSDGPLIPLRYAKALREIARQIGAEEPHLQVTPHKGRGTTPALPARAAGIPAITVGCPDGTAAADSHPLDDALQFALLMIDAIDAAVGELERRPASATACRTN